MSIATLPPSHDENPSRDYVGISVIVPVFNRSVQLRRLLDALGRQRGLECEIEVLICDDGSVEDLGPVFIGSEPHAGFACQLLRQENRGPGAARNLGLVHARAEVVAFTDSDCEPSPDWLASLLRAFEDKSIGLVGGKVDYRGAEHHSGRCVNFLMSSSLGAAGARDPGAIVRMDYYPRTCNLAVRRDLALAAGGFPEARHGEDLEFSHRVRGQGVGVRFIPDAIVLHNEKRGPIQVFRESFSKGAARFDLARRLGMQQLIHLLPALLVLYLLVLAPLAALSPMPARAAILLPALAYLAALVALAIHGTVALRDAKAFALVPIYAVLLHLGYGAGYLAAVGRSRRHPHRRRWIGRRKPGVGFAR